MKSWKNCNFPGSTEEIGLHADLYAVGIPFSYTYIKQKFENIYILYISFVKQTTVKNNQKLTAKRA